jgi:hypothetical protein
VLELLVLEKNGDTSVATRYDLKQEDLTKQRSKPV